MPGGRGGGGGQKTKWKIPFPKFEELIESITNMLLFFSGGGGGGGLGKKKL